MKSTNYEDYEQMSTEVTNSKYNNIGFQKKSRTFFTKKKIIIIAISISLLILILYLIFRPSKKSPDNNNNQENTNINDIDKEFESLSKKAEELKSENNKLISQKESLQKENDDLDKQIKELNDKNKNTDKKSEEKDINDKKEKIKEYEKKLNEIKDKIEQLNKKGKELKDKKEENDKEIKSIQSKIDELEKELKIEDKKQDDKDKEKKDEKQEEKKEENNKHNEQPPQPSNPELVARIDSKIIMELKQLELLDKWFERKLKFKLLFRATEGKYSPSEFHKNVDKYKNTLILIKDINNFIYGGFTTKTWDGSKIFKSDKHSILFNLDKEKYYEVKDERHAIFCDESLLAVFGDMDLALGPNAIESNFPKCYGTSKDIEKNELTMGYNKLTPSEMEVFQLS